MARRKGCGAVVGRVRYVRTRDRPQQPQAPPQQPPAAGPLPDAFSRLLGV